MFGKRFCHKWRRGLFMSMARRVRDWGALWKELVKSEELPSWFRRRDFASSRIRIITSKNPQIMGIISPIMPIKSKTSDITPSTPNAMFRHRRMINDLRFIQSLSIKYIFIENCKSETGWNDNFLESCFKSENYSYLCFRYTITDIPSYLLQPPIEE